jgi:hypothetical protein
MSEIEAHTVERAGFKGKKNGALLEAAEAAGYDVLLTVDQGIPHQQRWAGRRLGIVVLRSSTNQIQDLLPLVGAILLVLDNIRPGQTVTVPPA